MWTSGSGVCLDTVNRTSAAEQFRATAMQRQEDKKPASITLGRLHHWLDADLGAQVWSALRRRQLLSLCPHNKVVGKSCQDAAITEIKNS